jgi:hypothetical protein
MHSGVPAHRRATFPSHPCHLSRIIALPLYQIFRSGQLSLRSVPPYTVNFITQRSIPTLHWCHRRLKIRKLSITLFKKLEAPHVYPWRDFAQFGWQLQVHNGPRTSNALYGPIPSTCQLVRHLRGGECWGEASRYIWSPGFTSAGVVR